MVCCGSVFRIVVFVDHVGHDDVVDDDDDVVVVVVFLFLSLLPLLSSSLLLLVLLGSVYKCMTFVVCRLSVVWQIMLAFQLATSPQGRIAHTDSTTTTTTTTTTVAATASSLNGLQRHMIF